MTTDDDLRMDVDEYEEMVRNQYPHLADDDVTYESSRERREP